jgi:hypothetical protein
MEKTFLSLLMLFAGLLALLLSLFPSFTGEAKVMVDGYEAVNLLLLAGGELLLAIWVFALQAVRYHLSKTQVILIERSQACNTM